VPGNISTARSGIFWSQTDFFASGGELFPDPTVYVLSAAMPKGVAVDTQAGAVTDQAVLWSGVGWPLGSSQPGGGYQAADMVELVVVSYSFAGGIMAGPGVPDHVGGQVASR